jgi:hypothetical protein
MFVSGNNSSIDYEIAYDVMRGMRKLGNKWILDVVSCYHWVDVIKVLLPFIHQHNSIKVQSSNCLFEIDQRNLATYYIRNNKPFLKSNEQAPKWDDKIVPSELSLVVDPIHITLIKDIMIATGLECKVYCPFVDSRNIISKWVMTDNVDYRTRCEIPEGYLDFIRGDIPKTHWPYQGKNSAD